MYNIAICEDESRHSELLVGYLKKYEKHNNYQFNINIFKEAKHLIEKGHQHYDIIILDIHMDGLNGMDAAKIIRETNNKSKIVFVTILEKYCIEGYKVSAHRYILKPVKENEFIESIESIISEIDNKNANIIINAKEGIIKQKISEIYYIEISKRKTAIHTTSGIYNSNISMNQWRVILYNKGFSSNHNSFLTNMMYIEKIERTKVILLNKDQLPISRGKYNEFKDEFIKYVSKLN